MSEPWLSIIGIGEDGLEGLSTASRNALEAAEIVFGGPRHLALAGAKGRAWPVPFSVEPVLAERGKHVAVLVSGDPFWYGAGGSLMAHVARGELEAYPASSCFSLAAAALGWRLEETLCFGLHAAPYERLRIHLAEGVRLICTLRDGDSPATLARYLAAQGFGASRCYVLEALGGPRARIREQEAQAFDLEDVNAPVVMAVECAGSKGLPRAIGLPDELFASDGQMTKRPVRALTLSALAPRRGELLWDIGSGSGSISVEWALAAPAAESIALEPRGERCANIRANAEAFGISHRIKLREAEAPEGLHGLPTPDAVFIGGGANADVLEAVWAALPEGGRLVANAVTLETEALLLEWHGAKGGALMRFEVAEAAPLGRMRGWDRVRPIVQWSAVK